VYRFTVEQYHRMIETGVLRSGDRCELLDGWITEKMTQNPPHAVAIQLLDATLAGILPADWVRRLQSPITLSHSEPEPDVVVARGPVRRYLDHHPGPGEIALVAEVTDSTLAEDRTLKARIYAEARLPQYWIVNLVDRQVEVYSQPRAGRSPSYRLRQDFVAGDSIPVVTGGKQLGTIAVAELLP
jgi:Uma2 family endonuclease